MFVSVVIPTYNRRPILEKCLLALERQQACPEIDRYEVVVVDDEVASNADAMDVMLLLVVVGLDGFLR